MTDPDLRHRDRPLGGHGRRATTLVKILLNGIVPLAVYAVLRPHVGGDATALAAGAAVPVVLNVAAFVIRRRLDPIGVLAVVAFGVALIVTALSGGNSLVLKLQDAVVTGPIGVACLISVVVRRPLHLLVVRAMAGRRPDLRDALRDPARRRTSAVLTTITGALLLVHALALLVLALTTSTGTFLSVSRPVGWAIIGAGLALLLWYRGRRQARPGAVRREQPN